MGPITDGNKKARWITYRQKRAKKFEKQSDEEKGTGMLEHIPILLL